MYEPRPGDVILTKQRHIKWWQIFNRFLSSAITHYNKKIVPHSFFPGATHALLVIDSVFYPTKPYWKILVFHTTFSFKRPVARFEFIELLNLEREYRIRILRHKILGRFSFRPMVFVHAAALFDGYVYDIGQLIDMGIFQRKRARKLFDFGDRSMVCSVLVRAILEKVYGVSLFDNIDIDSTPPAAFATANWECVYDKI
ncbi:MAG: hypothetical protein ACPLYF_03925 [Fervidobacterium sp.]